MDPIRPLIRGVKLSASNPELAVLSWGVGIAVALALIVPLVSGIVGLGLILAARLPDDASGEEVLLSSAGFLLDHWGVALGLYLALFSWIGLVLFLYIYAQAGILGCVVRGHRKGPPGDLVLKASLRSSPAYRAFSLGAYGAEVRAHGWRVTAVATAYSVVALLPVLAYVVWALVCYRVARGGEVGLGLGIAGAIVGMAPLLLVLWSLGVHYRFAVVCAVLRSCGWREAVGAANGVFRQRTLASLMVVGSTLAARYLLGLASFLISAPFLLLSLIPAVGLLFLAPRLLIGLVQGLASSAIGIAALGATAEVCEPAGEDGAGEAESRIAGEKTGH